MRPTGTRLSIGFDDLLLLMIAFPLSWFLAVLLDFGRSANAERGKRCSMSSVCLVSPRDYHCYI